MILSEQLALLCLLICILSGVNGSAIVKRSSNESEKTVVENSESSLETSLFGGVEERNLEREIFQELNLLNSRKQREIFEDLEKQHEKFNVSQKVLVLSEPENLSPLNVEELKKIRKTIKASNSTLPAIRNKRTLNFLLYAVARAMGYTLTPSNPDAEWLPRQQPSTAQPCSTPPPPCMPNPPSTPPPCPMPPTTPPCGGSTALMQIPTIPPNQIDANTISYPYRPARTIPLLTFAPLPAGVKVPYPSLLRALMPQKSPCPPQQPSPPPCGTTPAPPPPPCGTTPAPPPCGTTPAPPPPPCKPTPAPPCMTPAPTQPPCTTPAPQPPPCAPPAPSQSPPCKAPAPQPPPCAPPAPSQPPPCKAPAPQPPPCPTPAPTQPPCSTPAPQPPPCAPPAPSQPPPCKAPAPQPPPCATPAPQPPPCGNPPPPPPPPPPSETPKKGSILLEYDDPVRIQIFSNDKKYLPASGNIFSGHDDDQKDEDWHAYFFPNNEKTAKKDEDVEEKEETEEHIEEEDDEEAPGQLKHYEEEDERTLANNDEEDESETSLSVVKKPADHDAPKTHRRRLVSSKTSVSNDKNKRSEEQDTKHDNAEKPQKMKKPKRKKWIRIVKKQRRKTKTDSNPHNNFQVYTSDAFPDASNADPKYYGKRESQSSIESYEKDFSDVSDPDDSSSRSTEDVTQIDLKKINVSNEDLNSPELLREARQYEFNFNPYALEPEEQRRRKLEKAVERYVEDYVQKQLGDELIKNTGVPKTTVFEFSPKNGPKIQTITTTVAKTSHSINPTNFKPQIKPETKSHYKPSTGNTHVLKKNVYEENSKKRGNISYESFATRS